MEEKPPENSHSLRHSIFESSWNSDQCPFQQNFHLRPINDQRKDVPTQKLFVIMIGGESLLYPKYQNNNKRVDREEKRKQYILSTKELDQIV